MRGRLIRPGLVDLEQIDTDATAADPGVTGLTSGYSSPWGEIAVVEDADGNPVSLKQTKTIRLTAQVEVNMYTKRDAAVVGVDRKSLVVLVFHLSELEELGLVDPATGDVAIRAGDRLVAMYDLDGFLKQTFREPGLYAIEPQAYGIGIGGDRNLIKVEFQTDDLGQAT